MRQSKQQEMSHIKLFIRLLEAMAMICLFVVDPTIDSAGGRDR
jgi:hypothetical protein